MYHKDKWVSEKDCTKAEKNLLRKIKAATENNGFKDAKCSDCKQKGLFLYGMAIHTVADIFAHSTKGVPQKYQTEAALQKETLITIKSKKLDHIYEGSWMGVKKQTVIKVPKSCLKKYKKAFRKAWLDKEVKIKAISGKKKFSQITFSEEKYKGLWL